MFLESIISGKRNLFWLLFHMLLGLACTITPFVLILWFYLILFSNFNRALISLRTGNDIIYIYLFCYLISFEMVGRMSHSYPFLPMELSKYGLISFFLFGLGVSRKKKNRPWIMLILLISIGLFFDYSHDRNFSDIINNYFGVLALSLGMVLLPYFKIAFNQIIKILYLLLFGIIPALIYTFVKAPNLEDIEFKIGANFATSAGAATNQVSTIFGLGMFICFYFWYKRIKLTGNRSFDLVICIAFLARGLLTFSRGGIIVGALMILILILNQRNILDIRKISFVFFGTILFYVTFNLINSLTGGKLLLRYQGETEGTYYYGAEKDINKITSSRFLIFQEDLKLWYEHPIFGVGVGSSKYIRGGFEEKIASHIELSRLLAEHGIFGLIFFISLLNVGFKLWKNMKIDSTRQIMFILFLIGLFSSFHSSMRTFVTPLLISISSIGMYTVKKHEVYNSFYRGN